MTSLLVSEWNRRPVCEVVDMIIAADPSKTRNAVMSKAKYMRLNGTRPPRYKSRNQYRFWRPDERAYLERSVGIKPINKIAEDLSRSPHSVYSYLKRIRKQSSGG